MLIRQGLAILLNQADQAVLVNLEGTTLVETQTGQADHDGAHRHVGDLGPSEATALAKTYKEVAKMMFHLQMLLTRLSNGRSISEWSSRI